VDDELDGNVVDIPWVDDGANNGMDGENVRGKGVYGGGQGLHNLDEGT